ncbi:hypothetical protein [Streptomyces sp. NPDC002845]
MDLEAVADELYGLRPEEFTAARTERAVAARKAGDRPLADQISRLRRPSLSAWASNLLVREQPDEIQPLLRLGEALRQAHHDLDGEQLRELAHQQKVLTGALSRQAGQLAAEAGHPISEDTQHEVQETLHAVLADPDAARQWATGRLTRPFPPTIGFPAAREMPPHRSSPAPPAAKPAPANGADAAADERRRTQLSRARQEAADAERELRAREAQAQEASRAAKDAKELVGTLQQRITALTEDLKNAEEQQRQARAAERTARERERESEGQVRKAKSRAEAATEHMERLAAKDRDRHASTKGASR